ACVQLVEDRLEFRMQCVLAASEVDGSDRETVTDPADIGEREAVDPPGVPVAVSAAEIAVVRESQTNGERRIRGHGAISSARTASSGAIRRKRTSVLGGATGRPRASAYGYTK